mgnify:CR=1 FL=1
MNIYKSLNEITQYIENNLEENIEYETLAKILGVNTYTLQQVFSLIAGISLSDYIRKRKLSSAGFDLYNKKEKLYCLHFFMNKGRRFLGDKNLSIIELTNCMKIKNCNDIFAEGESAIYEYIIALREQLKLSEAVYLVNYNLRNFEDEKNFKNIFK